MKIRSTLAIVTGLIALSPSLHAHRQWLLASGTVLSGEGQRISVEGAVSNDLFFPNHVAIPLAATTATAPDGSLLELLSPAEGKIRCSFELQLDQSGTYRITTLNNMMFVRWQEDGEPRALRGSPDEIAAKDLTGLNEVALAHYITRVETIVTCGAPTPLAPSNTGIEFEFLTHPNDLYFGETATFRVLLDGEPHAGAEITIVQGNDRFRDSVDELVVTSDAEGLIHIEWPAPGRFWLNTNTSQSPGEFQGHPLRRGTAYSLTLEVLPQ
ncbi:DUF4198 domain-containing protein [Synoicihabitans lomoniglobus]|uniref:DUF4198 domain-containing protein n=1 Tax=Synoicihabitans lomoniglobus TaxID=2909285 RepID=A0AAE9ZXR4_9BACT|nr:DUF4198 domain-containing protein [Opitutaceae bacterium LMO-M01]WED65501.1 DUF4198 domain-containing protein [Opitutaceae bacterium LMO-M01]